MGPQRETPEIHSSGVVFFFFSCLTFANSLARNLLEGSTIPLEDDISGSQPVLLSVTRQLTFFFFKCPHPGAIHAGRISNIWRTLGIRGRIAVLRFFFFSTLPISFAIMHVSPFISVISRSFSSILLSSNGVGSGRFRCHATVGQGLDSTAPRCQHHETTQDSKVGGQWCKGGFRGAHQASF